MSHIPYSVTSDARVVRKGFRLYRCDACHLIQKESTELLQKSYFADFISHALSDGEEQVKFVNGLPYPRSELILESLKEDFAPKGSILDIGSASGSFLKSFHKYFPNWELYAQDIQNNSLAQLEQLVPKEHIFITDIKNLSLKVDCISMIHLLGHINSIPAFLEALKKLSKEETKIIIQTPDLARGFFDVVIIDQITHFTKTSLQRVLAQTFKNIALTQAVQKELTACINFQKLKSKKLQESSSIETMRERFQSFIEFLYTSQERYIVLGTAPASTYIAALLEERCLYFVDEDKEKIGKIHLNKEIKCLEDAPLSTTILLPFLDEEIVKNIQKRHPSRTFFSFLEL